MKITKRDLNFLLALAGLLIFLALYFLVAQNYQQLTESKTAAVAALEPRLTELEKHNANLTNYEQETEISKENIAMTLKEYPAKIENEDFLVYLLNLESNIGLVMQSVSFDAPTVILQFPCDVEVDGEITTMDVTALRTGAVMTCTLNYTQLKRAIDYLYASGDRTALNSLSVSYNAATGGLTATFSIAKYLIEWEGAPYVSAEMPRRNVGTPNLFGSN